MDAKASLKGAWLSHVNHLNFGGHNHIPGMADRLRRCKLRRISVSAIYDDMEYRRKWPIRSHICFHYFNNR